MDRRVPAPPGSLPPTPSSQPSQPAPPRPSAAFLALVGLVIAAAVLVRLAMLGRQSYWIDELFSVKESAGDVRTLLQIGSTEVHTPFFAGLLWAWMKIGDTHEVWTRLLSTLCAVVAVLLTYRGLTAVRLGEHVRWALTAATAAGGTSIVYSLETRSYALLMLGSVGLTIATLRAGLLILDGDDLPRRTYLAWCGWSAFAATAHLFGAVLTFGALTVLAVITLRAVPRARARRVLTWVALAAAGCSLQAAWILRGLARPGFASGTDWIQAPDARDVWDLLTTTFSSGTMTPHKDGFAWTSPIGVISSAALCLGAVLYGYRARRRPAAATAGAQPPTTGTSEQRAAAILLALASVVIVATFGISQWTHLWTLRNLVIVVPALTWGVICLAAFATGTAAGQRLVATVAVVLLGVSLVPTATGLTDPYKTDFRGLLEYLISVQEEQPDARFVFLGRNLPERWRDASDRPGDDPALDQLYRDAVVHRRAASYPGNGANAVTRSSGTEVVTYYHSVANPRLDEHASALVTRLGAGCRRVPIYGLIVVRCH